MSHRKGMYPVEKVVADPPAKGSTFAEKELTRITAAHVLADAKKNRKSETPVTSTPSMGGFHPTVHMPARFQQHATPHGGTHGGKK